LTRRITSGEFFVGTPLPSQRELSRQYEVSLMTMRQALQALEEQGLVEQLPGKGTFVRRHRVPYATSGLRSLTDDLRAQGFEVDTRLLGVTMENATPMVSAHLATALSARLLVVERLRIVDGRPVVHQLSYVPSSLAGKLRRANFNRHSLYGLLEQRCGATPERAMETMAPVVIPDGMVELLEVEPGSLALRSDRVTFDPHGVPLVYDRALLVGDRMVVNTERLARSHTLTYQLNDRSAPGK
jgi:GntR family transcriptional regulator